MDLDEMLKVVSAMSGMVQRNPDGGGTINLGAPLGAAAASLDIKDRRLERERQKLALEQQKMLMDEDKKNAPLRDAQRDAAMWGLKEDRAAAAKAKVQREEQERMSYRERLRQATFKGEEIEPPTIGFTNKLGPDGKPIPTEEGRVYQEHEARGFQPIGKQYSTFMPYPENIPPSNTSFSPMAGPIGFASEWMNPFTGKKETKFAEFTPDPFNKNKWRIDDEMPIDQLTGMLAATSAMPWQFKNNEAQQINEALQRASARALKNQQIVDQQSQEAVNAGIMTPEQGNDYRNANKLIGKFDPDFSQTSVKMMESMKNRDVNGVLSAFTEYGMKTRQKAYMQSPWFEASEKYKLQNPQNEVDYRKQQEVKDHKPVESAKLINQKSVEERRKYRKGSPQ